MWRLIWTIVVCALLHGRMALGQVFDGVDMEALKAAAEGPKSQPLSAEAALKSLHVSPGYRVEQVAAEPLVMDPVAFDWGADGKLWVVEMADYPTGIDGKGTPGGRARYLEDTDGDGKYDKSTLYLDGLNFPTGIMAWRDGVLITAAPELIFARDTNGDGKADERKVLFTGFGEGNQQHRFNGLRWSTDGWVYLANGDSGGDIRSEKTGQTINISLRDLRLKPDEGTLEAVIGMTQFGRNRDDAGHWFGTNNPNPLYQFVLDDHYLRRNPHLVPPNPIQPVMDYQLPLYPLSRTLARFNEPHTANRFTSACSGMIYRDDVLPNMESCAVACEPVHNLVHREKLSQDGVLFSAQRVSGEEKSHLLRSTDNWFRPVMARTGPDGAIWIADMYREILEHPQWIPAEILAKIDVRAGHDKGRIYRIVPIDRPLRKTVDVTSLATAALVEQLDTRNGIQRDLVQRQLLWRRDAAAIGPLKALAKQAKHADARSQALWTLAGLETLDTATIQSALADPAPRVRVAAIRLAEPRLNREPVLGTALLALVNDTDPDEQLQLAYTLGEWNDPRAADALTTLGLRHGNDPYLSAAILSSVHSRNAIAILTKLLADESANSKLIEQVLTVAVASPDGGREGLAKIIALSVAPRDGKLADWQFNALAALLQQFRGMPEETRSQLVAPAAAEKIAATFVLARELVEAADTNVATQVAAINLLAENPQVEEMLEAFAEILTPKHPVAVQQAALQALSKRGEDRAAKLLLDAWPGYSPALRTAAIETLLARQSWLQLLLERLESKAIDVNQIDAAARQRFHDIAAEPLKNRVAQVFASTNSSRQQVIDRYQPVLKLQGRIAEGQAVFAKRCATCHQFSGVGHAVGADLATLTNKSPEVLLVAILDPNRAVEDKFVTYLAMLEDGRQLSGMLASESGESLTLRAQEGKEQVILRKDLEALRNTGKSLMPEGLEQEVSEQELADVIAFLRSSGAAK